MSPYERADLRNSGRANDIADAQRRYAFLQLVLAGAGVVFTGTAAFFAWRATHWAKEAAAHTKRSADADNDALTETRKAAEGARADALEAARRFEAQLGVAQEANRLLHESALAEHRPWLKLAGIEHSGITWDAGAARIGFKMTLQNVGRTPARDVETDLRLHVDFTKHAADIRKEMINDVRNMGYLIYPGDPFGQEFSLPISAEQIELADRNLGEAYTSHEGGETKFLPTFLIGVVKYWSSAPSPHHLGFIFHVSNGPGMALPVGVPLKASEIQLTRWIIGDFIAT